MPPITRERKAEIARSNARRSTGPKTPEGKAAISQNARKHDLFTRFVALEIESAPKLASLKASYLARFQPRDEPELNCVEQMVSAVWRMARCWSLETGTFNNALRAALAADPDRAVADDPQSRLADAFDRMASKSPTPHLLHRYETRYANLYHRALQTLAFLRGPGVLGCVPVQNKPTQPLVAERLLPEPALENKPTRPSPESVDEPAGK